MSQQRVAVDGKKCKRGGIAARDKSGHCLCSMCKEYRKGRQDKVKRQEYVAKWRAANKEKTAAYSRKWNANNKERRREIENAWKAKNPEKASAYNSKAGRKWSQENRAMRLASVRARQLSKLARTPSWADKVAILEIYELARKMSSDLGVAYEVDHIYPLQGKEVSGLHVHQNLRVITMKENRSKGNKKCEF